MMTNLNENFTLRTNDVEEMNVALFVNCFSRKFPNIGGDVKRKDKYSC